MNFKELGISEDIVKVLKSNGITKPTAVQAESIVHIKAGRDVIGEAQTGTGKTLAFLLPIFENISPSIDAVQALIVTPTRELAIQITEEALKLKEGKNINILSAYGGKDIGSQLKKLKNSIHLIIATPGRLLDHLERKTIDLSKLKTFVLDEADQMLLMGFKNEVEAIIKETSKKHQTLCFSATINSEVKRLAYRYMKDPLTVSIKKEEVTLNAIKQHVVETTGRRKQDALCTVLDQDNPFMAIIFCRTKRRADELEVALYRRGYNCEKLHSDIAQAKRERLMKAFRNADFQYLIATDVASRGLDISGVSHIYNYDIPETVEGYIHRIGRTGRAGEEGYTCLFVDPKDRVTLEEIERTIKFKIPRRELNGGNNG
jgi:ATP-dependent RNA helicase DeaD